jgi:Mn2+/Fe2+ NRAMP family transporter
MRSTICSGTIVSASTKHNTRPRLAAAPAFRAAAHVPPMHGTRCTPASSANTLTIDAVASSLASSATITSKGVSGSQRSARSSFDARATLTRMASSVSVISAASLRAGITNERRISGIAFQDP